jgi:hypothetical protein
VSTEARFNVHGKAADLWRADSGRAEAASYRSEGCDGGAAGTGGERIGVRRVPPARRGAGAGVQAPAWSQAAYLERGWNIRFDGLGAPGPIDDGAGLAHRQQRSARQVLLGHQHLPQRFTLPAGARPGMPLKLDLGPGRRCRGGDRQRQAGRHRLEAALRGRHRRAGRGRRQHGGSRVANLWVNRLVGDAQPGVKKVSFTAAPTYKADAPLRPSGLIGPVTLWVRKDAPEGAR